MYYEINKKEVIFCKGGDGLSVEEVRRRQAEKYRRGKFERLVRTFYVVLILLVFILGKK
jgi:hypothetical protein